MAIPLEGEARRRCCLALAAREDERLAAERAAAKRLAGAEPAEGSAAAAEEARLPELPAHAWVPRWSVLRGSDALPGQDVGRPVPLEQLARAKEFCEQRGLGGLVTYGGLCYLRPPAAPEALRAASVRQDGADLLLRPATGAAPQRAGAARGAQVGGPLRVAVLATQDEFDETSLFNVGMVSNTGNGRRYAAQALLRSLASTDGVELVAVLLYDWKNAGGDEDSTWPVPVEGPQRVVVSVRGSAPVVAWRGSSGQLLGAASGELMVDVAISIQARRSSLELLQKAVSARRYVVMGHDYNLPYGPWGMEVEAEALPEHRRLLEDPRTTMFCTSQHLANFVTRFSHGRVRTQLCYCADYGYFDRVPGSGALSPCADGDCVTFISPCPAKGLPIVLRLAVMLPDAKFLCVSTGWTKTLHEVQLRAHPNIEVTPGTDDVDTLYRRTAVLLVPSLWSESFGLVAVEAQLRGIPVVSTDAAGLAEANFLAELRVAAVPLVHDSRTREMLRGITMEEAERTLDPGRPGQDSLKDSAHRREVELAHTMVASEAEAAGFAAALRPLLKEPGRRRRLGLEARRRAERHVQSRHGKLLEALRGLCAEGAATEQPATGGCAASR